MICRYLSQVEKQRIVAAWGRTRAQPCLGRSGDPDPDILGLTDALNAIPGICTLQSCSGHIRNGLVERAHLWLKLSKAAMCRFYLAAPALAQHRMIESVSIRFGTGEGEIVEITFMGNECGLLSQAVAVILKYFRVVGGAS